MPLLHLGLILMLMCIWGLNFVAIKIGLEGGISPLMLCCARFFLTSIPLVFFVKRPKANFNKVISYGLIMFAVQFSLLFIGMKLGITPGLASLLLQVQVFFTIFFAITIFKEKLHFCQILGAILAITGIAVIWIHTHGEVTPLGFIFVLGAAFFWSVGNVISKTIDRTEMMPLVIWGSLVAWPPLFAIVLSIEGPAVIFHSLTHISGKALMAALYIGYLSTLFGFVTWNWLLHRHALVKITPFTLLVPIVAMFSSTLYFQEPFPFWKFIAGSLVLSGLVINSLWIRFFPTKQS